MKNELHDEYYSLVMEKLSTNDIPCKMFPSGLHIVSKTKESLIGILPTGEIYDFPDTTCSKTLKQKVAKIAKSVYQGTEKCTSAFVQKETLPDKKESISVPTDLELSPEPEEPINEPVEEKTPPEPDDHTGDPLVIVTHDDSDYFTIGEVLSLAIFEHRLALLEKKVISTNKKISGKIDYLFDDEMESYEFHYLIGNGGLVNHIKKLWADPNTQNHFGEEIVAFMVESISIFENSR